MLSAPSTFIKPASVQSVVRQNPHITEIEVAGSLIAIHGGGEGKRTWTGLTFQVADVVVGAAEIVAAGGIVRARAST